MNDVFDDARTPSPAHAVVEEILAAGGRAAAAIGSVAGTSGAQGIVGIAIRTFGKLTILVNNAGVIDLGEVEQIDVTMSRRMMSVTLDGAT